MPHSDQTQSEVLKTKEPNDEVHSFHSMEGIHHCLFALTNLFSRQNQKAGRDLTDLDLGPSENHTAY